MTTNDLNNDGIDFYSIIFTDAEKVALACYVESEEVSTIFRLTYARFVACVSSARLVWSRMLPRLLCISLLLVLVVVVLRTICAVILYLSLSPITAINSTFQNALYIFAAWDSGHYASIARYWYPPAPSREWSFFPLYPTLIRMLNIFGMDIPIGGLLVATLCGLASILVFQKLANFYLPRDRSLQTSLVYFLLPPVFVFSAVYYSEPVFLLFSLLSWYFCINGNSWKSCLAASLTTLVRSYGVLIVVPLGFHYLRRRQYWQLAYCLIPVLTLAGWMLYSFMMTGILAPLYSQGTFLTERSGYYTLIEETLRDKKTLKKVRPIDSFSK